MPIPEVRNEKTKPAGASCMSVLAAPVLLLMATPVVLWSVAASVGALNSIIEWWPWK